MDRKENITIKQIICPLDNLPCEKDCPDRYTDTPNGGCFLTTAQDLGAQVCYLGGDSVCLLFTPHGTKEIEP